MIPSFSTSASAPSCRRTQAVTNSGVIAPSGAASRAASSLRRRAPAAACAAVRARTTPASTGSAVSSAVSCPSAVAASARSDRRAPMYQSGIASFSGSTSTWKIVAPAAGRLTVGIHGTSLSTTSTQSASASAWFCRGSFHWLPR